MKYVISWTERPGMTLDDANNSLKVFSKWAPDPSTTFHQFVQRVDGRGGFAVVETDNPATLLKDAMTFGLWFEFEACPVMDMLEAAPTLTHVSEEINAILG